jgi:hypothetical protein
VLEYEVDDLMAERDRPATGIHLIQRLATA